MKENGFLLDAKKHLEIMTVKEIQHNGINYAIQSYKKYDQANICPLIQNVGSIIIDLKNKKIVGSYGKADKYWHDIVSSINLDELISNIDNQFN